MPFDQTHGGHKGDAIGHGVEHGHDSRANEQAIGNAERVFRLVRQVLHQAHHIIAHIADQTGGHRRQCWRQVRDLRFLDQRPQRRERASAAILERIGIFESLPVDLHMVAMAPPDQIRR